MGKPLGPAARAVAVPKHDFGIDVPAEDDNLADCTAIARAQVHAEIVAGAVRRKRYPPATRVLVPHPAGRERAHRIPQPCIRARLRVVVDLAPKAPLLQHIFQREQGEAEEQADRAAAGRLGLLAVRLEIRLADGRGQLRAQLHLDLREVVREDAVVERVAELGVLLREPRAQARPRLRERRVLARRRGAVVHGQQRGLAGSGGGAGG